MWPSLLATSCLKWFHRKWPCACLTIYVSYLLLETYISSRRKGAGLIGAVVSLFALMVN
eukprot:s1694_g1.t1